MTLSPDAGLGGDVAIINLVRNDFVPELSADLDAPIESGQLIINLRAEAIRKPSVPPWKPPSRLLQPSLPRP